MSYIQYCYQILLSNLKRVLVEAKLSNTEKRPVSSRGRARFWKGAECPVYKNDLQKSNRFLIAVEKCQSAQVVGLVFLFRAYLFVVSFPALRSQIAFIVPYRLEK